jgi:hypothetical protein
MRIEFPDRRIPDLPNDTRFVQHAAGEPFGREAVCP